MKAVAIGLFVGFAAASAGEFDLYARLERFDGKSCRILVNPDLRSGNESRPILCPAGRFVERGKYKLRVRSSKTTKPCELAVIGNPVLIPPETALPSYPDAGELRRILDCER